MIRSDPPRLPVHLVRAALLIIALLLPGASVPAQTEPTDSPQASLQDPPDLVIFQTGEVKGALAPGG